MFADDLIIFCKANPASLQLLMNGFQDFTRSSRLTANFDKSNIVFVGNCLHIQKEFLNITEFTECHISFRYLRLPITASRLTKQVQHVSRKDHIKNSYLGIQIYFICREVSIG